MTQIAPKLAKSSFRLRVQRRVLLLRRCFCCFWDRLLMCSPGNPIGYRILPRAATPAADGSTASTNLTTPPSPVCHSSGRQDLKDSDLVPLKISLLGDPQIGKTSFLVKYIGDEKDEQEDNQEKGLNLMDKTFIVEGARIYYSIWEVDGMPFFKQNYNNI
ncbi:uncharacterized protein LOC120184307 [Hibiscus syriacus]|uniref:uncharacterized protein LOC120184307 n=1 Tax=Hibiscus syriacus TaxID=106335 RepID=UPI0019215F75|nr:uncharacterized protein LOC120184307 [Hibiscus syriacus]